MQAKVALGNLFSDWVAKFLGICLDLGVHFWIENPAGSWMWRQRRWRRLRALAPIGEFLMDYCRWGMPWRKRTRFLTSGGLASNRLMCTRDHAHVSLRGNLHGKRLTKAAKPYTHEVWPTR